MQNDNTNRIDIIMATYNGEKYIKEQIESILVQNYSNFKLYIRDDGSNDKTIEIIEYYAKKDSRVTLIKDNNGNVGAIKNFELLLMQTNSNYIMFSDQDDVWHVDKLTKHLNCALKCNSESSIYIVYSETNVVDEKLNIIKNTIYPRGGLNTSINNILFTQGGIQGSSMMISNELKKLMLPFPRDIDMHDSLATFLAVLFGKICFIDEPLMSYRQHESNVRGVDKEHFFMRIIKTLFNPPPVIRMGQIAQRKSIYSFYQNKLDAKQKKHFENFNLFVQSNKFNKLRISLKNNYKYRNSRLKLFYKIIFGRKS